MTCLECERTRKGLDRVIAYVCKALGFDPGGPEADALKQSAMKVVDKRDRVAE